ncbi:CG32676 [Drosophila busckii]|uniref:CG32676 n=1 Tax=Drosophila busckii TaxID=30019 RepID=A0A0M4EUH6_DROBS|nr:CG32676 [Drosophila busckii]
MINLNINTTTGGNFGVSVEPHISVESLKKIVAKKLKVAKDRICLLHREKELQDGTLRDHNLMDGSKIILIPNVETGLLNIVKSIALTKAPRTSSSNSNTTGSSSSQTVATEQSPIKSLSNLVSSPIKTTAIKNIPIASSSSAAAAAAAAETTAKPVAASGNSSCPSGGCQQDPISAKLTSCLCTRLNQTQSQSQSQTQTAAKAKVEATANANNTVALVASSTRAAAAAATNSSNNSALHKTVNNAIAQTRSKHRHHHHHHHHHHHYHHAAAAMAQKSLETVTTVAKTSSSSINSINSNSSGCSSGSNSELDEAGLAVSDTRTLAEASRNLTQTLRKLSKEVFTNKIDLSGAAGSSSSGGSLGIGSGIGAGEETPRKSGSGAVIESMKNHGKGIYSGTFSGTLNPALQDRYGRPKRDISTVIHILNDLLSATPQYSRGARISFETPASSSNSITAASSTPATLQAEPRSKLYTKHHNCAKCNSRVQQQQAAAAAAAYAAGSCAYGECNGHYVSKSAAAVAAAAGKSSFSCCSSSNNSSSNSSSDASNNKDAKPATVAGCSCRFGAKLGEDGQREREHTCVKCVAQLANQKTKSKLDQIRLVMQQRKQKREARKLKSSPYAAAAEASGAAATGAAATATESSSQYSGVSALVATPLQASKPTLSSTETAAATAATATAATTTATAAAAAAAAATAATATQANEVSPNHIVEEVDTAA